MKLRALLLMWDWVTGIRIRLSFSITLSGTAVLHLSMTLGGLELIDRLGWKRVLSVESFLLVALRWINGPRYLLRNKMSLLHF